MAAGVVAGYVRWREAVRTAGVPRGRSGRVLVALAAVLAAVVLAQSAMHLDLLRLAASEKKLDLASRWLGRP